MIGATKYLMIPLPLQMGDEGNESDAFHPEPAVVLRCHISGRRHVRVPEIVHRRQHREGTENKDLCQA